MDWNKVWSKKYPILKEYEKTVDTIKYSKQINNMIKKIKNEYNLNTEDAMLVLKDILYKEYLKMK